MRPLTVIGYIDDCQEQIAMMKTAFSSLHESVKLLCYKYPEDKEEFKKSINAFDRVMIDFRLGGANGANLARTIIKEHPDAVVAIVSSSPSRSFTQCNNICISKLDVGLNPEKILTMHPDKIDRAVEISVLVQSSMEEVYEAYG